MPNAKEAKAVIFSKKKAHNAIAQEYEKRHPEIFNDIEKQRLSNQILEAVRFIQTTSSPKKAMDFGCGSGNLTHHLLRLQFQVTSADVSKKLLSIIQEKYPTATVFKLNGSDLSEFKDNHFDFVGIYSVLHHIPDYLAIIKEAGRVTKRGGIIYVDHEASKSFWSGDPVLARFFKLVVPPRSKSFKRFFKISNYVHAIRLFINPKYAEEGDIHTWPDDHIEWAKVEDVLNNENCEIVLQKDYLNYKSGYPLDLYNKYKDKCGDDYCLIARKRLK